MINNKEFLKGIFRERADEVHVTAFHDDPSNIHQERRMHAWGGGSASIKLPHFVAGGNEYFTISLFNKDEEGKPRRRKALFDACYVIVVDDVNEKIPADRAGLLPPPSYKLFTSESSEQWGYILSVAETDSNKVNNLLDGLVSQGLAPTGVDPGMKGVTRYVRLPDGYNTKAKRYVDGKPFKCYLSEWNPERKYAIEALALSYNIDLTVTRAEATSLPASQDVYSEHPIWQHVVVTGVNGDWTMIDCPNVEEHTGDDASGAAVLLREDGTVGFQCHHGSCNGDGHTTKLSGVDICKKLGIDEDVRTYVHGISKAKGFRALADSLVRDMIQPPRQDNSLISRDDDDFNIMRYIYIPNENKFYDICTKELVKGEALNQLYMRTMPGGKEPGCEKAVNFFHKNRCAVASIADGVGWVPFDNKRQSRDTVIIDFNNKRLVNSWSGLHMTPVAGDPTPWLEHIDYLIPDAEQRKTVIEYLAFTLQKPHVKVAYTILHRGSQGVGKDLSLIPVMKGLGIDSVGSVTVTQATDGWGDHLARKKFLIIEEVDKAQNRSVNNALKTLLSPTATGVRTINMKHGGVITQLDCLNTYMMSNRRNPISLEKDDRRYFVVDSFIQKKDPSYYRGLYSWLEGGGSAIVLDHLLKLDISTFQDNAPPSITSGMLEMQDSGRYDYEISIEELINEKASPFHMPMFTLTTLKEQMKKHDVKAVVPSIIEAVEDNGFKCVRGTKRIDGKTINTPKFFIPSDSPVARYGVGELHEYYFTYKTSALMGLNASKIN